MASNRYITSQRWAIDLDWQESQSSSAIAVPYGYRQAPVARKLAVTTLFSRVSQRHLMHGLMLTVAVGVVAGSVVSGQQPTPPPASSPDSSVVSSLSSPAAIVARVVPETRLSAREAVPLALPDESKLTSASAPVSAVPAPELKSYEVQDGDNPFDLAQTFNITEETLLAANGLGPDSVLQVGQKLLVPPVTGVVVSTQPGETAAGIASQWKLDLGKLLSINKLGSDTLALLPGEPLVLPDAQPPVSIYPQDSTEDANTTAPAQTASTALIKTPASNAQRASQAAPAPVNLRPAIHAVSSNYFPWGQCTFWAAQQRPDIGSRVIGNAASWLYSARASGLATGSVPRPGAVVVYQPGAQGAAWTGHVAYVTSVAGDGVHFTVSEMNFPWWGRVTTRSSSTGWGVAFIY